MTVLQIVGYLILITPVAAIFKAEWDNKGVMGAVGTIMILGILVGMIHLGAALVTEKITYNPGIMEEQVQEPPSLF